MEESKFQKEKKKRRGKKKILEAVTWVTSWISEAVMEVALMCALGLGEPVLLAEVGVEGAGDCPWERAWAWAKVMLYMDIRLLGF